MRHTSEEAERPELVRARARELVAEAQDLHRTLAGVEHEGDEHLRALPDAGGTRTTSRPRSSLRRLVAPRRARRSRFRSRSRTRPSAVTTSTETRLSAARPCLRRSQPIPPESVRPGDPGLRDHAERHREAERLCLTVEVAERDAALRAHRSRLRVDLARPSSARDRRRGRRPRARCRRHRAHHREP